MNYADILKYFPTVNVNKNETYSLGEFNKIGKQCKILKTRKCEIKGMGIILDFSIKMLAQVHNKLKDNKDVDIDILMLLFRKQIVKYASIGEVERVFNEFCNAIDIEYNKRNNHRRKHKNRNNEYMKKLNDIIKNEEAILVIKVNNSNCSKRGRKRQTAETKLEIMKQKCLDDMAVASIRINAELGVDAQYKHLRKIFQKVKFIKNGMLSMKVMFCCFCIYKT